MIKRYTLIAVVFILGSCVAKKREYVMPYYNGAYNASRLQPLNLGEDSIAFRAWINNGTNVERIISISNNPEFGVKCSLDEIGNGSKEKQQFYRRTTLEPRSGAKAFFNKIDSLKIFEIGNQKEENIISATDSPFSFYVIEYKKLGKYHSFKFYTTFPRKSDSETIYTTIEKLIRSEFKYDLYFK